MFEVVHTPKFYYSGSKKWRLPSDRGFIVKRLAELTEPQQRIASERYEQLYLRRFNQKQYREARYEANRFLQDYTNRQLQWRRQQYLALKRIERQTHVRQENTH
ncbi:hypothetical protein [Vibrio coralliilyticus]|uniref:hypothetical protein n=1 Tax=Vibrio coralliilyticus TaxID=190893 RepID=UPI0017AB4FE5|nr:hypothetical protein [Vibrio coralliilyticus]NUW66932.1 hypothetical protein [Vibrio coralliilyticus]NUW70902.1 hypothetical protein [Vibrio coralliilyticus]